MGSEMEWRGAVRLGIVRCGWFGDGLKVICDCFCGHEAFGSNSTQTTGLSALYCIVLYCIVSYDIVVYFSVVDCV